jgi:site-specific DNA recombinase
VDKDKMNSSFNEEIKTTNKMKKVIGYIRVSTEYQKIKGNSVKNQIQSIKNYCSVNDLELVKIYEDKGISGMSNKRIGLNDMFDNIKNSDIEGLIVYSLSRLGRKLKDVIDFIDVLSKNDIRFISLKENFNNNDIVGKLMFNILGSINEFEVNLLSQRISDVKQYKKSVREVYSGKICFGLKRNGKKLIDNNTELETLKLIHKLRNNKMSYFKISDYLNERNILSKENKQWYGNSVRSVYLNNVISVTN